MRAQQMEKALNLIKGRREALAQAVRRENKARRSRDLRTISAVEMHACINSRIESEHMLTSAMDRVFVDDEFQIWKGRD